MACAVHKPEKTVDAVVYSFYIFALGKALKVCVV